MPQPKWPGFAKRDTAFSASDTVAKQHSQLLASLLLVMGALQLFEFWLPYLFSQGQYHVFGNDVFFFTVFFVITALSYYSCQRMNYKLAARTVVIFLAGSIIATAYPDAYITELNLFAYYLIPLFISSMFLSIRTTAIVLVSGIVSMALMAWSTADPAAERILMAQGQFILIIAALMVIWMIDRNRQEAQRALQQKASEQQLRLITDNIQEIICLTDLDGTIHYISPSSDSITDLSLNTFRSIFEPEFADRMHPDDRGKMHPLVAEAIKTRTPARIEYRFALREGDFRWLETNLNFLFDKERQAPGMILVTRDIQERKEANEALTSEHNLLRTLIDHLPDQIYVKDRQARFVLGNKATTDTLGLACEQELIGKSDLDYYAPHLAQRFMADDLDVIENGRLILDKEESFEFRDGEIHWFMSSKAPLYNAKNEITGLVGSTRDITERKRIEAQLREAEKLHIELEKEKELSELKNRFMTTISHEFRTPLATILSSTEIMERYDSRLTPERRYDCLRTIHTQVNQLTALLQDFTTITHLQRNMLTFEPRLLNIAQTCQDIVSEFQARNAPDRDIRVMTDGLHEEVGADKRLLQHILTSLISNAVKYSDPPRPIRVEATREGANLVFQVIDQGIGIPPEDRARLFEPFFRGTNVGTIGGTGLGLKIVQDCVDVYRGSIQVESETGKGSRFIVRLPIAITD